MPARASLCALTALNLAVLALGLVQQLRPVLAETQPPVLRGRALQIVDGQGRVRASISVLPPGDKNSADEGSETVLFRLITERGRPTVKIAASSRPTGTKDSYLILQTKGTSSSLRLRDEDGHEQVVTPH